MNFYDVINGMKGRLEIYKKYEDGSMEKVFEGPNAITYRGKIIMARLLAGGLLPNSTSTYAGGVARAYNFGSSSSDQMRVTGMAFGNGGHLLYDTTTNATNVLPKSVGLVVDHAGNVSSNIVLSAMPYIGGGSWGYAAQPNRAIPGTTYEKVENGNIPWDGTINITDNALGVSEANTTLYSETFRVPLDDTAASVDGYSFPTNTEVQFKATLPQIYLNYTGRWGFSSQSANLVSEAGLIVGYRPDVAALNTGQVYSHDGAQPGSGSGYNFGIGQTNWGSTTAPYYWNSKDGSIATAFTGTSTTSLNAYKSLPSTVSAGVDTWGAGTDNRWNIIARKNFPAITKGATFALVFVWTIGF